MTESKTSRSYRHWFFEMILAAALLVAVLPQSALCAFPVAIKTSSGYFLKAVDGGGRRENAIHSNATSIGPWAKFKLIDLGYGEVAIQTLNGHFVTAVGGGGRGSDVMHTDRTRIGSWERFRLVDLGDGEVAIQTWNRYFLAVVGESDTTEPAISSYSTTVRRWERFKIVAADRRVGSCLPSKYQIALFRHASFAGDCTVLGGGEYPNAGSIGLQNDSISSIRVGENVVASLCWHSDLGGTCETFTSSDSNFSNNRVGNDTVSSARVSFHTGDQHRIVARHSGKCLNAWGSLITQNSCNNYNGYFERWTLIPVADKEERFVRYEQPDGVKRYMASPFSGNHYLLESALLKDRCLAVGEKGRLTLDSCQDMIESMVRESSSGLVQSWKIETAGDSHYQIVSWSENKCLDVVGYSSAEGARIGLYDCHQGNNQLWRVLFRGDRSVTPLFPAATYMVGQNNSMQTQPAGPPSASWSGLGCVLGPRQDSDHDSIADHLEECVARYFAPILILHEEEDRLGWPSSAEWFWDNSYEIPGYFAVDMDKYGYRGLRLVHDTTPSLHPGEMALHGMSPGNNHEQPPVYYHVYPNVFGGVSIQYWYFFPYNGTALWHWGDWEHVTLRLDAGLELDGVSYYHHKFKSWTNKSDVHVYEDHIGEHPFVYVAERSHASYPTDHRCDTGGVLGLDECDNDDALWWLPYMDGYWVPFGDLMTARSTSGSIPLPSLDKVYIGRGLKNLGERGFENFDWECFEGRWGSRWGSKIPFIGETESPVGPLWKSDRQWLEDANRLVARRRGCD